MIPFKPKPSRLSNKLSCPKCQKLLTELEDTPRTNNCISCFASIISTQRDS